MILQLAASMSDFAFTKLLLCLFLDTPSDGQPIDVDFGKRYSNGFIPDPGL